MANVRNWAAKSSRFFREEIWRFQPDSPKGIVAAVIRCLRIFTYAAWGFHRDNCHLRASALTFYSLLSIVPIVAMAFAVAKGFGFRKLLEKSLIGKLPGHEAVLNQVIISADSFLDTAKGGLIAGVGVVFLFWSIIKVFGHIEEAFNDIWRIRSPRSVGRKFGDYLSMMLLCPLLLILSSSFAIFLTTEIRSITDRISLLGMLTPAIFLALDFFPYLIIWTLFTLVYVFMPNTKVRFLSALPAGITAGTIFQIVQYIYLHFQVGVAQYNAVYGSFAALPLFFIWLRISWVIVLFGAEMSYAVQTDHEKKLLGPNAHLSLAQKRLIALNITHLLIKRFQSGEPPLGVGGISFQLGISPVITESILLQLRESGLISAVTITGRPEPGYQPGRAIAGITILEVVEALDNHGEGVMANSRTSDSTPFAEALSRFKQIIRSDPANRCLKDM